MTMAICEAGIAGKQRRIEGLGEDHIGRIVHGLAMSQGPDSLRERSVFVPFDGQGAEVLERGSGAILGQPATGLCPAENLDNLKVEQVWGMQGAEFGHNPCDPLGSGRIEQEL